MSKPHPHFNPGPAQLGLAGGNSGKGDADRSPGWRENYDEIGWPAHINVDGSVSKAVDQTFTKLGPSHYVKKY